MKGDRPLSNYKTIWLMLAAGVGRLCENREETMGCGLGGMDSQGKLWVGCWGFMFKVKEARISEPEGCLEQEWWGQMVKGSVSEIQGEVATFIELEVLTEQCPSSLPEASRSPWSWCSLGLARTTATQQWPRKPESQAQVEQSFPCPSSLPCSHLLL